MSNAPFVSPPSPIPPGHCARCGHSTEGLPSTVCPECGADLAVVGIRTNRPRSHLLNFSFRQWAIAYSLLLFVVFSTLAQRFGPHRFTFQQDRRVTAQFTSERPHSDPSIALRFNVSRTTHESDLPWRPQRTQTGETTTLYSPNTPTAATLRIHDGLDAADLIDRDGRAVDTNLPLTGGTLRKLDALLRSEPLPPAANPLYDQAAHALFRDMRGGLGVSSFVSGNLDQSETDLTFETRTDSSGSFIRTSHPAARAFWLSAAIGTFFLTLPTVRRLHQRVHQWNRRVARLS